MTKSQLGEIRLICIYDIIIEATGQRKFFQTWYQILLQHLQLLNEQENVHWFSFNTNCVNKNIYYLCIHLVPGSLITHKTIIHLHTGVTWPSN